MGYELKHLRKDCFFEAEKLGNYQELSIDDLANGYCLAADAKDEAKKNQYMGALMLKFWSKISKLHSETNTLNTDFAECQNWLTMAILTACLPENRVWQKRADVNAESAINKTLATRFKAKAFYEANLDIKKANYNSISLQSPIGNSSGDDEDTMLMDTLPDESLGADFTTGDIIARQLIQNYIKNNKIVEAIIFDTIAYNNVEKITTKTVKKVDEFGNKIKYKEYYHEFWAHKLVEILNSLPEDYSKYFSNKYSVATEPLKAAIEAVNTSNNTKLYKFIRKALLNLKETYKY